MQKIRITSTKGEIIFSDVNESHIDDDYLPLVMKNFDPNSNSTTQNTINCVGMHGQHTISSYLNPKTITFDIVFDGKYRSGNSLKNGGVEKMYEYRRKIINHIPFNEVVLVEYTNNGGTYYINARLTEVGVFTNIHSLCKSTIFLIADYPFWYKNVAGNVWTAVAGSPRVINVNTEGDISSPVIGIITCIVPIVGVADNGEYFRLSQTEGSTAQMRFIKNLKTGEKLIFNTGLNNEVYVKLIETDGSIKLANNYVLHNTSDLLINNIGETKWRFSVYGTAGELSIQINYQNLYLGV